MQKLLFILLLWSGFSSCSDTIAQSNVIDVNAFEAKISADSTLQLVDVRTPEEYNSGHIQGAVNYNIADPNFGANLDKLDKTKPVLVYCAVGGRSARAAGQLQKKGFTQVFDLKGGMNAWRAANKKVAL
jgi:rhodanese-related sulfurtransferase